MFEVETAAAGTLHPKGEIDLATAPELIAALAEAQASGEQVVVDMADVTFIDSCGLHALAQATTSSNGSGPLVLTNVAGHVVRLMKIVEMDRLPSLELRTEEE